MADCCKQMQSELRAIKSELAALRNSLGQKVDKHDPSWQDSIRNGLLSALPGVVTSQIGSGITQHLPQIQNALGDSEAVQDLVKDVQNLKQNYIPKPNPTDAVLGGKEGRELAARLGQVEKEVAETTSKFGFLKNVNVAMLAQLASLATSLASAGISLKTLYTMAERFAAAEKFENRFNKDISDLQTQIGTLNSRTKDLQTADSKLNSKVETALDRVESNKLAIGQVSRDLEHTNGIANNATIQAQRAERNLLQTNANVTQINNDLRYVNGNANKALSTAQTAQSSISRVENTIASVKSTATTAQSTANRALSQSSSLQGSVNQAQQIANNASNMASRALSTAQTALSRPIQQLQNVTNVVQQNIRNTVNNTIVNPIRERVVNTIQTREVQTIKEVQTVRELKTIETVREEVIDQQTKAAISRIESTVNSQSSQLQTANTGITELRGRATSIQNGLNEVNYKTGAINNTVNQVQTTVKNTQTKVNEVANNLKERFDKLSKRLKLPEIINALTLIVALHNAAMLSRNLLETLGDLISTGLAVIGLKDEENNPIDINGVLGKAANDFISSILGEQVWKNLQAKFQAANRSYQSASNILWNVRSMFASTRELIEWTGENTGKIGNALKKSGVVFENSYNWMPENLRAGRGILDRIDRLDDTASSLSSVVGEVANIQQEADQMKKNKEEFDKAMKELGPKPQTDNAPVKTAVTAGKAASAGVDVQATDTTKAE